MKNHLLHLLSFINCFVPFRCAFLFHRYQRFPTANMPNRFNYPVREHENPNQMRPFNSIASVYEVVQAKVGSG